MAGRSGLRFAREKYFASVEENSTAVEDIVMVTILGSEINENLKFRILNPTPFFEIRDTSGVIRTTGVPFDREEKENFIINVEVCCCLDAILEKIPLNIIFNHFFQARSMKLSSGFRVAHVPVHVVVMDRNDNAPLFVNTPYYGVISSDSEKGSVIFKVNKINSH